MSIHKDLKFEKSNIINWLEKIGIHKQNNDDILDIFLKEIIYKYIQDEYKIFVNGLNLLDENQNNHKYLKERFYKNIFDKNLDIGDFIERKEIKLSNLEKMEISKVVSERYINRQLKSIIIMGSLDIDYLDWRNNILSRLNQKILLYLIKKILFLNSNIKPFINIKRFILKKNTEKSVFYKKRSKFLLDRQVTNPQRVRLINRKQFFITDIISNPHKINSNYLFIKSYYAISSYVGFTKQEFDPLYLCALEIINNRDITFKNSYINKFYKNPKNYKFGKSFNLGIKNKYYELDWENSFSPWAHKKPRINVHGGTIEPSFIKMRFLKIRNTIENILEFGFIPTKNDIIKGYFLVKGNEYRFIVLQGWHRLAVLKALHTKNHLKFNYIPVTFDLDRSKKKIVLEENIRNWPAVKEGNTSLKDAEEIFNSYFI